MKPNYYAIIPAEVRYNNKLTANSKLLFGEITALTNKTGVCWATNKYFAELYSVDKKTVSRWIQQLQEEGYLDIEMEYDKDTKIIVKRSMKITAQGGRDKNVHRGGQKDPQGRDKNVEVNIYTNNKKNIIKSNTKTFKKVSDFDEIYISAYEHIIKLFHERNRPKDTRQKVLWLDIIRLCHKKDKVNPKQLWWLCNEVKKDSFWAKNFQSLLKLRSSKDGVMYLNKYIGMFGNEQFEILALTE
jgi:hypothetical protein